jgi:hypothetical protein
VCISVFGRRDLEALEIARECSLEGKRDKQPTTNQQGVKPHSEEKSDQEVVREAVFSVCVCVFVWLISSNPLRQRKVKQCGEM